MNKKPLFPCKPADFTPSWCIKLGEGRNDRTVYLNYFHMTSKPIVSKPRSGSIDEQVEQGIQQAKKDIEWIWGPDRPTYVVPPDLRESDLASGCWSSPRYRCFAWVSSTELDGEKHGSHAFLIWWQEGGYQQKYDADCPSPIKALERILKTVSWEEIAADFYI